MKKIETIWHYVLHEALTHERFQHTQQDLARKFRYSLSTVHHALEAPSQMGAIRKAGKFFVLHDFRKLLYFWASIRSLNRDILYSTTLNQSTREIEGMAIPGSIYATYRAARQWLGESPADYSRVYFYVSPSDLSAFQRRFPPSLKEPRNTFALKMAPEMREYGSWTTLAQTFVDIWSLSDWYGRDFTQALQEKMNGLLS
ncbi:MAG: hypothetical protein HYS08_07165 [Chlamydiae bacterium]|nr:hypothetical protein [Chlamydiota bacterium]MBI3265935.1 hypothetical protein [Chlamydiota bacterium]